MTTADVQEVPGPHALQDATESPPREGATAFILHAVAWVLFYLTVVIAWGQRNSWPSELLLCILSLPITVLVASTVFAIERFGFAIEPEKSQQEQLIAALVLAVGLASGQVLLMSLGLVCLGIAWLRPARPGVDWTEWLKIPLIFLTALPFWLDFEGSRSPVARLFDDPASNPVFHLPLALTTTQAQMLGYCGLLSMVLFVRGRAFWLALPVLPLFLVAVTALPRVVPKWAELNPLVRAAIPWLVGLGCLAAAARVREPIVHATRRLFSGETFRFWFEGRRYPPWLAVLVVAVVQVLPLERLDLEIEAIIGWLGLGWLFFLLLRLRKRTPRGPIHSRSVAMVAGGLALTLVAEFTANEHLRHVALSFVVIGLVSWHCFWPLRVFVLAGVAGLLLLMFPEDLNLWRGSPWQLTVIRLVLAGASLALLTWLIQKPMPLPGERGYSDDGWVPPKRFALILLGLMMLFQTASAFWPEHDFEVGSVEMAADTVTRPGDEDLLAAVEPGWLRVPTSKGPIQLMTAFPRKNPYLLESPERTLRRRGWKVVERIRAPHPLGEATALRLERDGSHGTAIWWFELGQRVFSNHLYARRVLWSGWHLADRQLKLVRVESTALRDPADLIALTRSNDWFTAQREIPRPVE